MLADLQHRITHDPATEDYRAPLGAVPTSSTICFRLHVRGEGIPCCRLVVFGEGFSQELTMTEEHGWWQVCWQMPECPCVVWYYFLLRGQEKPCYYGAVPDGRTSFGALYPVPPPAFQITVYAPDFSTPAWFRKSVMYQIFPDRFAKGEPEALAAGLAYHQALGRKLRLHKSWQEQPDYLPQPGEATYDPLDVFGGTLQAITERLDYLQDLGISVLYLNPIFEAASNHRYDTADYGKIDPLLGTEEDFRELCRAAAARGIHILLDGVFSHTGADSVYFNRYARYPGLGAYQGADSPFFSWYDFQQFPDDYRCWWRFKSLPEVIESDPAWQDFIIHREDSVLAHWLSAGAAGFRLDVADELPDEILTVIRQRLKRENPAGVVLGEVWEDATNKVSYGVHRSYALGTALDSVMNYPFRQAVVAFLQGRQDARQLQTVLLTQRLNYPAPLYYCLMNLLSSHDIERIRSALAVRLDPRTLSRPQQATFRISRQQNARGRALQRLAMALQFALPGVPAVYYGDEQGMQGFLDPFNRAPFSEQPGELAAEYRALARLRRENDALATGAVAFFAPTDDVLAVLRFQHGGYDCFGEQAADGCLLLVINRAQQTRQILLDFHAAGNSGFSAAEQATFTEAKFVSAMPLLPAPTTEIIDGLLVLTCPPISALWYYLEA